MGPLISSRREQVLSILLILILAFGAFKLLKAADVIGREFEAFKEMIKSREGAAREII